MNAEIKNNRCKILFQRYLSKKENYPLAIKLKGLHHCGSNAIVGCNDIFLVQNLEHHKAEVHKVLKCHSAWACPACTAEVMAKKGAELALIIDALKTLYHETACMITFTLPHMKLMTCEDSFQILLATWRRFTRGGKKNKIIKRYTLKSDEEHIKKGGRPVKGAKIGDIRTYKNKATAPARFRGDLQIERNVKIYEFTWGENSWHGHIHALYWIPDKLFKKATEYEDELLDYWWYCAKLEALRYYNKKYPDKKELNQRFVDKLYAEWKKAPGDHKSVYISKNDKGEPIPQESSFYITGWSADIEMTGQEHKKCAKPGHYTPAQIIELAETDTENREKWLALYTEYALATRHHRRMEYSKNKGFSFRKLIEEWKKTQTYTERLKKKPSKDSKMVICAIPSKSWSNLYFEQIYGDNQFTTFNLLSIASRASPENLAEIQAEIQNYLSQFDIKIDTNPEKLMQYEAQLNHNARIDFETGELKEIKRKRAA